MTFFLATICTFLPVLLLIDAYALSKLKNPKISSLSSTVILLSAILSATPLLIGLSIESTTVLPSLKPFFNSPILRFDTLSTTMFLVVTTIGLIVIRFSSSYLNGDERHVEFIRKLVTTIALVQILVLSGNLIVLALAWISTSFGLTSLIQFYKDRKRARLSAQKKFIVARMSDLALLSSFLLLYLQFGTVDLEIIFTGIKNISFSEIPPSIEVAALLLVLSAIIKSVQVPFHGWIIDVMEAPTPVSGLLHAGLLNAGPFLIIRFSYLLDVSSFAPLLLLCIGALSAIYGTIIYPTQPSVKTGLAYSSVGHMGFSLMLSGMGLYSASLLHLVAHSFYKAHAFLSSGSAVDKKRVQNLNGNVQFRISVGTTVLALLSTCILYVALISVIGESYHRNFQVLIVGGIIVAGVSSYLVKSFGSHLNLINTLTTVLLSSIVLIAFFTFEGGIAHIIGDQIPTIADPSLITKSMSALILGVFVAIILATTFGQNQLVKNDQQWNALKQNGFYVHLVFDQFLHSIHRKLVR